MPSFLKHIKCVYDVVNYPTDTATHITRTFKDTLAIDPTTKSATDGVISGSPTSTFTSATANFTSADVNKYLYITSGSNLGLYPITVRNSATSIQVSRNFIGNATAIPFTVSSTGNLYPYYHYVTYNGAEIPNRIDETVGTFAKHYYELDTTTPGQVVFHLYANQAFIDTNYFGSTPAAALSFSSTDVFTINYLIEV